MFGAKLRYSESLQKRPQSIVLCGDAAILVALPKNASLVAKSLDDERGFAVQVIVEALI